jgi:hypothetical protein
MIDFARTTALATTVTTAVVTAVLAAVSSLALSAAANGQGANFPPPVPSQNIPAPVPAQGVPSQAGAANPVCARLEGQLAVIDRGGFADPARADQNRRYEDAISKQQADLDRTLAQSRRLGCEGGGFFSIFGGQNPQCPQINQQVQQMRANLDRMMSEQQRLQGGGGGQESQRQVVIAALAQNNCGPQYRAAANEERGFFDSLFGSSQGGFGAPDGSPTYRTLCVRTCDGYYFPVSFATTPARFQDDEQICQRTCPGTDVMLFSHRNPGGDVTQAVSASGKLYTELPTAFKYRQEFSPSCSCRKPGQSWADALGQNRDMTVERGDIIVTEERSKVMSAPRDAQGRPLAPRKGDAKGPAPADANPPPADDAAADTDQGKRNVRVVGPPFVTSR